jgi:hypothetical protein
MKTKEIWKDIPNYEGLYQVSNLGRVKSLDKTVVFKDGRIRKYKECIRKQHFNKKRGYYYVSLKVKGVTKTISTHTLVFKTFMECEKGLVIDHIDNNQKNNNLENLQQITYRENNTKDKKTPNVCFHKRNNKYMSYFWLNGKNHHIGYFLKYQDAVNSIIKFKKENNA